MTTRNKTIQKVLLVSLSVAIFFLLIFILGPILTPFVIAFLLAYWVNPLINWLKKKLPQTVAVLLTFSLLIIALAVILGLILPLFIRQISAFLSNLPGIIEWFQTKVWPEIMKNNLVSHLVDKLGINQTDFSITSLLPTNPAMISKALRITSRSGLITAEIIMNVLLVPVISFYFLWDWPRMIESLKSWIPVKVREQVVAMITESGKTLSGFLRGQMMVVSSLAIFYSVSLAIMGLKVPLFLGIFTGCSIIIPYFGYAISLILASVLVIVQFHDLHYLIITWAIYAVGQASESFLLTPFLVGEKVGLHPTAVIFAILTGAKLFGFLGVLLAVPVSSISLVALRHLRGLVNK